jgi:hypothetical protein
MTNSDWVADNPIRIDPSAQAQGRFGSGVAMSGDGKTVAITWVEGFYTDPVTNVTTQNYSIQRIYNVQQSNNPQFTGALVTPDYKNLQLSKDGKSLSVFSHGDPSSSTGVNSTPIYSPLAPYSGAGFIYTVSNNMWRKSVYLKATVPITNTYNVQTYMDVSEDGQTVVMSQPTASVNGLLYFF